MVIARIASLILLLICVYSTVRGKSIPSQLNDDTEVEFVTGSPDAVPGVPNFPRVPDFSGFQGFGPNNGRGNVFTDWMNWIQGFFKDGNWDNGGPANFAKFLGNQVARLVEMLTRDGGIFSRK